MKITKYEHAFLVLEEQGKKLVVDPGVFTKSLPALSDVVGIVITHVHADHWDEGHIKTIVANNPKAQVISTQEVADELKDQKVTVVTGGDKVDVEPFRLDFFGGRHAFVYNETPQNQNVGVMVNDKLYHPGDSFDAPSKPVEVLAVPTSAPWLKTQEYMDFVEAVKPKQCFPTHNALLSEIGAATTNNWLKQMCDKTDTRLVVLDTGQSVEI